MNTHLEKYYKYCFNGFDLDKGIEYINSIPEEELTPSLTRLQKKINNRFVCEKPRHYIKTKDKFIRDVIIAYRDYLREIAYLKCGIETSESNLLVKLKMLLDFEGIDYALPEDIEFIEDTIIKEFEKRGYNCLAGITKPFRSLYVWEKTEKQTYNIELPSGRTEYSVFFMYDFLENSWLSYFTFGKYGVGGWAKEEGMYCNFKRYEKKIDSNAFYDNFLVHEAQHISDYKEFPDIKGFELEYRAKLVELILGSKPLKKYQLFFTQCDENPENPHGYAAFLVSREISKLINAKFNNKNIKESAAIIFEKDTQRLKDKYTAAIC